MHNIIASNSTLGITIAKENITTATVFPTHLHRLFNNTSNNNLQLKLNPIPLFSTYTDLAP